MSNLPLSTSSPGSTTPPAIPTVPAPKAPTSLPSLHSPFDDPDFAMKHGGVSLLGGWLPHTIEIVALVLVIAAIGWRNRRWRLLWLPLSVVSGLAAALAAWQYTGYAGLSSDPAPVLLWVGIGVTVAALFIAVFGWRSARWWRRVVSVLAIPLSALTALVVLNQWVGYYPTWHAAWSAVTAGPLPNQVGADALEGLRNTHPTTGKIVPVDIPDISGGFAHRGEYVYLPPTWFAGSTPPQLPVIMMIGGEFNTPADWVRSAQIMPVVNKFTTANGGVMPIMVFVDSGGSFNNDTECVDGPRGNSASHLTKDVPLYIEHTFGAAPDPAAWAVVGWSMGGTCAIDLTVMHPELFHTFIDIAGDRGPTAGTKQQTISRLFGGNAAQWAAYDPITVMSKHGSYTGVAGLFDDLTPPRNDQSGHHGGIWRPDRDVANDGMGGVDEDARAGMNGEIGAAEALCAVGKRVGISCTVFTTTGDHTWQFASAAFIGSLPWLTARVGLPVSPSARTAV